MTTQLLIPTAFLRCRDVRANIGIGRSTLYRRIQAGLFTPPVPLGGGLVAWPASDVEALNQARLAGRTDEQIKALVSQLVESRSLAGCEK